MSVVSFSDTVFVLHARAFQETSLVIECLGVEQGRFSCLARSARKLGRGNKRSELQMTAQINVMCRGKGELKTLTESETLKAAVSLTGDKYAVACYVSEVAMRILQPQSPCPDVYNKIEQIYQDLHVGSVNQVNLRLFELSLLDELGEGVDFQFDMNGESIDPNLYYDFRQQSGFEINNLQQKRNSIKGDELLKIADHQWDEFSLAVLKQLTRRLLASHLGEKPLKSRELWRQWEKNKIR
ncbi:MAG: DNA repair protein RecO [Gammaproteobacteria bacterium]|nr:DNA repair protein RecO [Gammaproteobacteria bacterium]